MRFLDKRFGVFRSLKRDFHTNLKGKTTKYALLPNALYLHLKCWYISPKRGRTVVPSTFRSGNTRCSRKIITKYCYYYVTRAISPGTERLQRGVVGEQHAVVLSLL